MALSVNSVFEVRTGGADTNGGGFVTGASGTDRSLQDAAHATGTNLTVDATTNTDVAPDGHTPAAADVGNIIQITTTGGGAAFTTGWYQIVSIQSGKWRLDRSPAATSSAGATWFLGGALASPGIFGKIQNDYAVNGFKCWLRAGPFTLTSSSANVAGGKVVGASGRHFQMEGYTSTRGDAGVVTISCGAIASITVFAFSGSSTPVAYHIPFRYLKVDANGQTAIIGFALTGQLATVDSCQALSCTTGFSIQSTRALNCLAESCTTGFLSSADAAVSFCRAKTCTTGFNNGGSAAITHGCLATGGTTGFKSEGNYQSFIDCTAYGQSGSGFTAGFSAIVVNCYAEACGAYGFNAERLTLIKCAGFNNTSGNVDTSKVFQNIDFVTLSGSAFVNAAGDDFRPNDTASAGALLRGVARGVAGQTNNDDIGAVQHADPAGGGGSLLRPVGMNGGLV